MLIYTPKITSRIKYSFQLIFDTVWKIDYQLIEDLIFLKVIMVLNLIILINN